MKRNETNWLESRRENESRHRQILTFALIGVRVVGRTNCDDFGTVQFQKLVIFRL